MKKMLNESNTMIVVSNIRKDAKNCLDSINDSIDCNELGQIYKEKGATVAGSIDGNDTIMTVSNMDRDEVINVLNDFINDYREFHECDALKDAEEYIISANDENDLDNDIDDFPPYDENEDLNNVDDFPPYDENEDLNNDNIADDSLNEDEDDDYDDFPPFNDDDDYFDIFSNTIEDMIADGIIDETKGEHYINRFIDDIIERSDIDVFELNREQKKNLSKIIRDVWNSIRNLNEKKKGCCPKKSNNLNENVDKVLNDINKKSSKNNVLVSKVNESLKLNKKCLHENVKINGKSFKDIDDKTLKQIKKTLIESKKQLTREMSNNLNESVVYNELKEKLNKKNQLLEYIEEELTYRDTRISCIRKLYEDGKISDEELANLFGSGQGEEETSTEETSSEDSEKKSEETSSDENNNEDENTEEVELARIEITLKSADALIDLKNACVDAGIPEDAMETKGVDDEAFEKDENDEENSDENSSEEETSEENSDENSENNEDNNTSESLKYFANIAKLFEAEETEDGEGENNDDNSDENSDDNSDENEDDKKEEDEFKLIITNTDYTANLAKVLDNLYGITKEEFEQMIGGKIVEEDSDEEKSDEDKSEEKEEKTDDNKDSEESNKEESNDDDDIDPSELFKGL